MDAYINMASLEVEVAELKKNRRIDEKRIRVKILNEYDSLVEELVREIAILRHRFHEYQLGNFNDVMTIITESKKEKLLTMKDDESFTLDMRNQISSILRHEEEINKIKTQNFELKMTVKMILN
jgi:hypothetical protein